MTCYSCGHQTHQHDEEGYCRAPGCGCSCYVPEDLAKENR